MRKVWLVTEEDARWAGLGRSVDFEPATWPSPGTAT
jgi:hypothetical protein